MPKRDDSRPRRACCLVSEILEEAGLDRRKAREIRRQILEGIILLCRWQLERIGTVGEPASPPGSKARRVAVD